MADPQIEEAEQRGYVRGLNVGLVSIGSLAALAGAWRSFYELPLVEEVFRQVKVVIPALTMLVLEVYKPVGVLLILAAAVSIWATRTRGRERFTTILNAILFGSSLLWFSLVSLAIHSPLMLLFAAIGSKR